MGIKEVKKEALPICPFMSGNPVPMAPGAGVLTTQKMTIAPMAVPCASDKCMLFDVDKGQCSIKTFMIG